MSDLWNIQQELLQNYIAASRDNALQHAREGVLALSRNSAAYQLDALRNGEPQPMLVIRMKPNECKITILEGQEIYTGDYIDCFGERWLVVEKYKDENASTFARAYLCNHLFRFQNHTPEIIKRWGVMLDSNYVNRFERHIAFENGWYKVYLPLDEDTRKIYVDKRFALSKSFNHRLEEILSVIKVVWTDQTTGNLTSYDHLLKMRVENNVYDRQRDNVELMICDYIEEDTNA